MDETETHARTGFEIQSRPLPPRLDLDYDRLESVIRLASEQAIDRSLWHVRFWFWLFSMVNLAALVLVIGGVVYVSIMNTNDRTAASIVSPFRQTTPLRLSEAPPTPDPATTPIPTEPLAPPAKKNYPPSYKPFYGEDSATRKPKPPRP